MTGRLFSRIKETIVLELNYRRARRLIWEHRKDRPDLLEYFSQTDRWLRKKAQKGR